MRAALDAALSQAAKTNPDIFVVVGDVSPAALGTFTKEYPRQFINVGVAEANMVSMSAGLALSGKMPFLFTIGTFMTMRCYEQIRDDLCFQNLNVKIIGGGGGFIYSTLGGTHHTTEDYAILRVLPNMVIVSPADPLEVKNAVQALVAHKGPAYLRLGRAGDTNIYTAEYKFELGKAVLMRPGSDLTIIGSGSILKNVLPAADLLRQEGIEARVLNMHTIKPIDRTAILAAAKETGAILTVEEHQVDAGLGSSVAEVLADNGVSLPFLRMGVPDTFLHTYGSRDYLLQSIGLDANSIAMKAKDILKRKK